MKNAIIEKLNGYTFEITEEMLNGYEKTPVGQAEIVCEDGTFQKPEILLGVVVNGEKIFYERFEVTGDVVAEISKTLDIRELCAIDHEIYDLLKEFEELGK